MGATLFVILATNVVLLISSTSRARSRCPIYCECWDQNMRCDGKRKKAIPHIIPRAPSNINKVVLRDINLGQLTKNMTSNLTYCSMTSLILHGTNITSMAGNAFEDLKYLEIFIWEQSYISFSVLNHCLGSINKNLKELSVKATGTNVDKMNATMFHNLTQLTRLSISLKKMKVVDVTALSHFLKLGYLDLSSNSLLHLVMEAVIPAVTHLNLEKNNFVVIPQICLSDGTSVMPRLQNLNVGGNAIKNVYVEPLICLHNLQNFTLSENGIEVIQENAFANLSTLRYLALSNNELRHLKFGDVIPNMTHLNLVGNNFAYIPQICQPNSTSVMPKLQILNIGRNAIKYLNVKPLICLDNFTNLILSENRIEVLQDNAFADLSSLRNLYLYKLPLRKICDLAFNSSSLYKLQFSDIPSLSIKRFNPANLFKHTPNLGILDMSNTKMKIKVKLLKELLLNLKNIKTLVLQRTKIKELPSAVFSKLTKLKKLILSGNYFSSWDSEVFENVTSIIQISFDGCNIKTISEDSFPLKFRLSVKEINLCDNPFICTCDLLWFRNWMKDVMANKSIKFSSFPYRYECRAPKVDRLRLTDFNPTVKSCTVSQLYTIILTTALCFCLVSIVVGLVAYRYRWHLLYWISLLRRRRREREEELLLRNMKYDAFVSHSNNDDDWIYDELLDYVEGELGLRLCEHSRDFDVGKLIIDNVFDAIDTSAKTILVISNDYMQSDWCQFELQMALNSFYKHETGLLVVLLEPIKACHVTNTLRALMTSTTYIEWAEDPEAQNLFRERIKTSLKN